MPYWPFHGGNTGSNPVGDANEHAVLTGRLRFSGEWTEHPELGPAFPVLLSGS